VKGDYKSCLTHPKTGKLNPDYRRDSAKRKCYNKNLKGKLTPGEYDGKEE